MRPALHPVRRTTAWCGWSLLGAAVLLLAACGSSSSSGGSSSSSSSGGSSGPTVASLAGTWYGLFEDYFGYLGRITVVVDSAGTFTSTVTGTVYANGTSNGTISAVQGNIFGTNANGSVGGFMVDSAATHAGFVDDSFDFAVVQKGASTLPSYTSSDINGSWSGSGVHLTGAGLTIESVYSNSTTVTYPSFSGTDGRHGAYSGSFSATSLANAGWQGSGTQAGSAFDAEAFLSADKTFAGWWACDAAGGFFPDACTFGLLNK